MPMLPDAEVGDETGQWWAVPLVLLFLLVVAPLVLWAGIWIVFCYLDTLFWLYGSLPWPGIR